MTRRTGREQIIRFLSIIRWKNNHLEQYRQKVLSLLSEKQVLPAVKPTSSSTDGRKLSINDRLVPDNKSNSSKVENIKCRRKLHNYIKDENKFIDRNKNLVMKSYYSLQKMESVFNSTMQSTNEKPKVKAGRKDFHKMIADEVFSLKTR